jgi:prepilin-type N-terminal cleavage/methylation domain-containing protein
MNWRVQIRHKGFSLAEVMMVTVVLSIAAAGVLLPFTSGEAVRVEGARRTLAAKLAGDLVEQILTAPFDGIVADYDGYVEMQGGVKDVSGTVFSDSNYGKFSRAASCQYVYMPQESWAANPQFILVTVKVYYSGREIASLNRLVAK